jgi:hypothetical protein
MAVSNKVCPDRLADVIIHSEFREAIRIPLQGMCSHGNDRQVIPPRIAANGLHQLHTIHLRHLNIRNDLIELLLFQESQSDLADLHGCLPVFEVPFHRIVLHLTVLCVGRLSQADLWWQVRRPALHVAAPGCSQLLAWAIC